LSKCPQLADTHASSHLQKSFAALSMEFFGYLPRKILWKSSYV